MTYTIDTVQDLVRVLDEHPQWLDALRGSDAAAGRQGKPACGRDATVQGCCRTAIRPTGSASFHRADVIVEASDRGGELCYVAVEASYTVNGRDSSRAIRNAGLLTRFTGCRSYAVVAGLRRDDRIQDRVDAGEVFWCDTDTPAYGAGIVIRRPACSRTGRSRTPWRPSRVRRGAPVHLDGQQGDRSTARCSDRRSSAVGPLERGGGQTATV